MDLLFKIGISIVFFLPYSLFSTEKELLLFQQQKTYLFATEKGKAGVMISDHESDTITSLGAPLQSSKEAESLLHTRLQHPFDPRWHTTPPLQKTDSTPIEWTPSQLAQFMQTGSCAIYSGAGLSHSSGIPVMHQIEHLLQTAKTDQCILKACKDFYNKIDTALPTKAHLALAHIAKKTGSVIYTENLDTLHEAAQTTTTHFDHRSPSIKKEDLLQLDAIICLGLSRDWRGVLASYKKVRPDGIIIAIDLATPEYIKQEDGIIYGDLQQLLPAINALLP